MKAKFSLEQLAVVGLVAVIALIPPLVHNNYQVFILTLIGLYTMLTVGLSLVMGYAGQVSLGHATFFGVGAYATALLSARFGLPPLLALVAATAITAIVGFLLGGKTVLLGNRKLMDAEKVDMAGLEAKSAELQGAGRTVVQVAHGGRPVGLI